MVNHEGHALFLPQDYGDEHQDMLVNHVESKSLSPISNSQNS